MQAAGEDVDVRATRDSYTNSVLTANPNLGWALREPLAVTVDPNGLDITTTTFYDPVTGQPIEKTQPASTNGTPGDPPVGPGNSGQSTDTSATQTYYYAAGTLTNYPYYNTSVPSYCQSTPLLAGLVCETQPAVQPTDAATSGHSASMPSLPDTGGGYNSSGINAGVQYNVWDQPTTTVQTVWDTSGNQDTRTATNTYYTAGQPKTSAISATGTGGTGSTLPTVTDTYYPTTGLPDTQTTGSSATITAAYDGFGRVTAYEDANGNTACYYYDIDSRLTATVDSKTDSSVTGVGACPGSAPSADATSYGYDPNSGQLASTTDAASGLTFYGASDADGNLLSETYPNGMTQATIYNENDTPTSQNYLKFTNCILACTWFTDQTPSTIHGQWTTQTSNLSHQTYNYDTDGRLTQAEDTVNGGRSFSTASLLTSSAGPTSVITGPDGNVWVAEDWVGKVAKITPSGNVTEYSTGSGSGPTDLTVGPDGNIWFAGAPGNEIGKITTAGTVTTYSLPANSYPTSIARGAGNTLVYTDYWSGKVGVITTSGSITQYQPPTAYADPANIVQGSDGNDYFVEYNSTTDLEQVGEFNTTTDTITEQALKSGSSPDTEWDSGPGEAATSQGVVWFVDDGNKQFVEYNLSNPTSPTYFNFPSGTTEVEGLTLAKDGTVWFTEGTTGEVGQLTPTTGAIVQYTASPASTSSTGITQGPDGNIWFADNSANKIYTVTTNGTTFTPTAGGTCTTRQYGFNSDSDRTSLTTITSSTTSCNTTGGATQNYTFDSADRLTASGGNSPTYDPFGRIADLPANLADPAGQNALTSAYYVNDTVQQLNQANQQITYNVDPALRILQRQTLSGGTTTYENSYYDDPSDNPAWTQDVNSSGTPIANTWARNISGIDGNLAAIQTANSTTLEITDLHSDVVGTASTSATAAAPLSACDATEYGVPRSGTGACTNTSRYSYLGGKKAPTELSSGVIAMGARVYVPTIGAFLQPDPNPGADANSYGYANDDPVNQTDLGGDASKPKKSLKDKIIGAAKAGVVAGGIAVAGVAGVWGQLQSPLPTAPTIDEVPPGIVDRKDDDGPSISQSLMQASPQTSVLVEGVKAGIHFLSWLVGSSPSPTPLPTPAGSAPWVLAG
jgi:RHS repeat-associated protein